MRRTSPVICDWGNGEDTHPLNQQILQKIISCQILSDFCDCYLSVAKFHSMSIFINFFFAIDICHLQKIILFYILRDCLWLLFVICKRSFRVISYLIFRYYHLSFRVILYPIFRDCYLSFRVICYPICRDCYLSPGQDSTWLAFQPSEAPL